MQYLMKRGNRYYYYRRVPNAVSDLVDSKFFKLSLKTDSKELAKRKCVQVNAEIESYWESLLSSKETHTKSKFDEAVDVAKIIGFNYLPIQRLSSEVSRNEIYERILLADENKEHPIIRSAILGTVEAPEITVSKALETFWTISKDKLINKSEKQIRKWKNPRKKAIRNFINICDDLPIEKIERHHLVKFKNWWVERIETEGRSPNTVNKEIINLKNIIQSVALHYDLKQDFQKLFRKLTLKERQEQLRKPFDSTFIKEEILHPNAFSDLNDEAKNIVFALINTGARPSEIIGLSEDDIKLDYEIPHVLIRPNKFRNLKTPQSTRVMPLLGCSLEALKKYPTGFLRYRGKPDSFSSLVNKYFRNNDLLPSKKHSLYSLRHGFQDRLTRSNVNDRMQAELMGHKFNRPLYGDGPTLEQKQKCLIKISL
ncbi:site-specific integrase [Gracilimonas sp.]|uniref:site-specific integrase n=1 Tax=Gracilimonas sp. TaxID=1974203 RepID=UPI0032ECB95F